jgi:hypothetical protein
MDIPSQNKLNFNIVSMEEQNPDLSIELIGEILKAQSEEATEEYTFG